LPGPRKKKKKRGKEISSLKGVLAGSSRFRLDASPLCPKTTVVHVGFVRLNLKLEPFGKKTRQAAAQRVEEKKKKRGENPCPLVEKGGDDQIRE